MTDKPFLSLWVADFLGDTSHLNGVAGGAYLHLLFWSWIKDSGVPRGEDSTLAQIAKLTPEQWSSVRESVLSFFDMAGRQKRLEIERKKADKFAKQKSNAGKTGAKSRWNKRKLDNAVAMRSQWQNDANHTHTHTQSKKVRKVTKIPDSEPGLNFVGPDSKKSEPTRPEPVDSKPVEPTTKKSRAERSTRWPVDAVVAAEWIAAADALRRERNLGPADLGTEAIRFANHFASNGAPKVDWRRTWLNWSISQYVKSNGTNGVTGHERNRSFRERIESIAAEGFFDDDKQFDADRGAFEPTDGKVLEN